MKNIIDSIAIGVNGRETTARTDDFIGNKRLPVSRIFVQLLGVYSKRPNQKSFFVNQKPGALSG